MASSTPGKNYRVGRIPPGDFQGGPNWPTENGEKNKRFMLFPTNS